MLLLPATSHVVYTKNTFRDQTCTTNIHIPYSPLVFEGKRMAEMARYVREHNASLVQHDEHKRVVSVSVDGISELICIGGPHGTSKSRALWVHQRDVAIFKRYVVI